MGATDITTMQSTSCAEGVTVTPRLPERTAQVPAG